jgi:hypothetical protein
MTGPFFWPCFFGSFASYVLCKLFRLLEEGCFDCIRSRAEKIRQTCQFLDRHAIDAIRQSLFEVLVKGLVGETIARDTVRRDEVERIVTTTQLE